jgi:hypothetical protein
MNTKLACAIEAVNNAHEVAHRLAQRTADTETRNVSIQNDNSDFNVALSSAQTKLEAAREEVEGQTLTNVESALRAVRRARAAYYLPADSNRLDAANLTKEALRHLPSAPVSREND